MALKQSISLIAVMALLVACSKEDTRLRGERLTPREAAAELAGASPAAPEQAATAPAVPETVAVAFSPLWSAKVGSGETRKERANAAPALGAGRIFTLDPMSQVTATATNGAVQWTTDLTPTTDRAGDAAGGGIAFGEGMVFATTGYGELVALDPANGAVLWRQSFDAAVAGAPAVAGGKVLVSASDGTAWAVTAKTGKVAWSFPVLAATTMVEGSAAPTVTGDTAIFPFSSGAMVALNLSDGAGKWQGSVAGKRPGRAYASFSDLTGSPVVAGGMVYAGASGGGLSAFDLTTGKMVWTSPDGALNRVVVEGGALFLVNDEDQLLKLDAGSGQEIWRIDLPYFEKTRKDKRRKTITAHYGPVMVGGRLVIASTDGYIRAFDPASGKLLGRADIPKGAAATPVVAGGVLYILSQSGQLHAFR